MIETNIAIIKNIHIFLKIASENLTNINIKFFKNIDNIPLDNVFNYIIIDKNIENELINLKSFLNNIKYEPNFIYFYSKDESFNDFKDIANNINITKIYEIDIEPHIFLRNLSIESTINFNQPINRRNNITIPFLNFNYDYILKNILQIVHTTSYINDLSDAIYSILETLAISHGLKNIGIYLFNNQKYFGLIKTKNIKIGKYISKNKIISVLNNSLKEIQLLSNKQNSPFIEKEQNEKYSYIIPLINKNDVLGYFITNLTTYEAEKIHSISNFLKIYADTIIPIFLNYDKLEEMNKKNIEYSKLINDLNRLYHDLQIHSVAIDQIRQITRKIFSRLKLKKILEEIVNDIEHLLDVEYSLIFFKLKRRKEFKINKDTFLDVINFDKNKNEYIKEIKKIIKKPSTIKKNIIYPDDIFYNIKGRPIKNYLGVPLTGNKDIKGYIFVFNKPNSIFNETDLFMLNTLAESSITAILNAQLVEHLNKLFLNTINTLAATIEARDKYTKGHTDRVGAFVKLIATKLNWDEQKIKDAYIGGILHDIGKIGIDDAILRKPGKLTPKEFEEIKKHCEIGYKIVTNIEDLKHIGPYILYHHEKYDGTGYPFGIKGEDIPIEGRIIAIADAFDAMISHRPYKKALPIKEAINEIKKCKGSHFDPIIADIFIELYNEGSLNPILKSIEN